MGVRARVDGGMFEHDMQAAVIQWAWLQAPSLLALAALHAIPNGARTSQTVANRLKREGMRAGIHDLVLPVPAGGYHGLYQELKTHDGTVSKDQKAWHATLDALGYRSVVCRTIEGACDELKRHAQAWEGEASPAARAALLALLQRYRDSQRQKEQRPVAAGRRCHSRGH
jgi:hypothetical protein